MFRTLLLNKFTNYKLLCEIKMFEILFKRNHLVLFQIVRSVSNDLKQMTPGTIISGYTDDLYSFRAFVR